MITGNKILELIKQDLRTFSEKDIAVLARFYNIPKDIDAVARKIGHHTFQARMPNDRGLTGISELDEKILLEMDYETLNNICITNKYARAMCDTNVFWKRKAAKDFGLARLEGFDLYKTLRGLRENANFMTALSEFPNSIIQLLIKTNPYIIGLIVNPGEDLQLAAVKEKIETVQRIQHPYPSVISFVVKTDPSYITKLDINKVPKDVQLAAVNKDPNLVKEIDFVDTDVQISIIDKNPRLLWFIKNPTNYIVKYPRISSTQMSHIIWFCKTQTLLNM
jgi:hypothetical protein